MCRYMEMSAELECTEVYFHEFLAKKSSYEVFVFFEGKDDFKYYNIRLQNALSEVEYVHWNCNGKENVIELHEMICNQSDTETGKKTLFFIDMDFDDNADVSEDIYVTPYYSIENFYVTDKAFKNLILGEMNFSGKLSYDEKKDYNYAYNYLKEERNRIVESCVFANAWYYLQVRNKHKHEKPPKLNDLNEYKKVCNINCCEELSAKIKNAIEVDEEEVKKIIEVFNENPVKYIRGKYYEQTMFSSINKIFELSSSCGGEFIKKRKVNLNLGKNNMVSMLSHHAETPKCLTKYINKRLN